MNTPTENEIREAYVNASIYEGTRIDGIPAMGRQMFLSGHASAMKKREETPHARLQIKYAEELKLANRYLQRAQKAEKELATAKERARVAVELIESKRAMEGLSWNSDDPSLIRYNKALAAYEVVKKGNS